MPVLVAAQRSQWTEEHVKDPTLAVNNLEIERAEEMQEEEDRARVTKTKEARKMTSHRYNNCLY